VQIRPKRIGYYTRRLLPSRRLRNAHHSSSACRLEPYVLVKTPTVESRQGFSSRDARGSRHTDHRQVARQLRTTVSRVSWNAAPSANDSIRASAGYVKAGYTLHSLPWRPHLQAEYDYASGDPRRDPSVVRTFDQFYPSNHDVFGLNGCFRLAEYRPRGVSTLIFIRQSPCMFTAWRNSGCREYQRLRFRALAVYSCIHPSGGFGSDRIGTEVDGALQYAWKRIPLLWELGIGHFWPGALMSANNHGATTHADLFPTDLQAQSRSRNF